MAITVTDKGPNSTEIDYTAGESLVNIAQALEDWILLHGWTLHDAAAGANARAYTAVCKDGVRQKTVVIDFNTANRVYVKTYESWNATTHTGVNICHLSNDSNDGQQINLTAGGKLYAFATVRYLILFSSNGGVIGSALYSSFCGCFETFTDNSEDTSAVGVPCWLWANGGRLALSAGSYPLSFPRLRNGGVTTSASSNAYATTRVGVGSTMFPSVINAWNGKSYSLPITACYTGVEIRGRMYGLKATIRTPTYSYAPCVDEMDARVDADFMPDPTGSLVPHWIIGENGTYNGRYLIPK
jgi:hypothetical protein